MLERIFVSVVAATISATIVYLLLKTSQQVPVQAFRPRRTTTYPGIEMPPIRHITPRF